MNATNLKARLRKIAAYFTLTKLLRISALLTILGLIFMLWSMIQPTPLPVILAMSVGQGFGTLAFLLYLIVIVQDLRRVRRVRRESQQELARRSQEIPVVAPVVAVPAQSSPAPSAPSSDHPSPTAPKTAAVILLLALTGSRAEADPLRLRADALATTSSPAGLLVLGGEGTATPGLSAEAIVWLANARVFDEKTTGDVLVIDVRGRSKSGLVAGTLGRFVSTMGALRPVQIDGGSLRLRLPAQFDVEVMAGMPVALGLGTSRTWDWVAGTRVARRFGEYGSAGVAFAERRDDGRLATEELGFDAGFAIGKHDLGGRVAYDVANPGVAEVAVTSSHRFGGVRVEAYAIHREASHLIPATSLFSVIGDVASQHAGTVVTWRAAPRLDVIADGGARFIDGDVGVDLTGRARLRLDDRGTSVITGELRRGGVGDDAWTGARATARVALPSSFTASTELELVRPDMDRGHGTLWPWALAALAYERGTWQGAVAVEASVSPEYSRRVDILAQLCTRWGAK